MDQLYRVKIIDFGSANISNDKLLRTMKVNSKLGRLAEIIEKF